ncbi:MAG: hypothetical protein EOP52_07760 [Sphingobacteriales bacterium]|nr:MAG: hypothetical protein EOP52_07760 [Sphingobacteriales bacterium]
MRCRIFATLVATSTTAVCLAQKPTSVAPGKPTSRDSLKAATISVYQTYQPELKPVFKPLYTPSVPETDTTTFAQEYKVLPQPAALPYYPVPIRPLALQQDTLGTVPADYIKLGLGNRSTFLLEGATTRIQTKNLTSALYLRHFRQADERVANRRFNETQAAYNLTTQVAAGTLRAQIDGLRNSYGEYAFNEARAVVVDGLHTYFGLGIRTELEMTEASFLKGIKPQIAARYFDGPQIEGEWMIRAAVPFQVALGTGVRLSLTPSVNFTRVGLGNTMGYNNLHSLATVLVFDQDRFSARVGAVPTYVQDKGFRLLPDLMLRYALVPQKTALELGWKGTVTQNRLEELAAQNPFLTQYTIAQTESKEAYAELNTNLGKAVSFSLRGSYWHWKDLPLFVNNLLSSTGQIGFGLEYTEAKAATLQARLRYAIGETVQVGVFTQLANYYPEDQPRLWHIPAVRFGADVHAAPVKNLQLGARISFADQFFARGDFNQAIDLGTLTDLRADASYQFIPHWSVWVQGTNLLNARNERFYGYPAIGRGIAAGLRVQF